MTKSIEVARTIAILQLCTERLPWQIDSMHRHATPHALREGGNIRQLHVRSDDYHRSGLGERNDGSARVPNEHDRLRAGLAAQRCMLHPFNRAHQASSNSPRRTCSQPLVNTSYCAARSRAVPRAPAPRSVSRRIRLPAPRVGGRYGGRSCTMSAPACKESTAADGTPPLRAATTPFSRQPVPATPSYPRGSWGKPPITAGENPAAGDGGQGYVPHHESHTLLGRV